MAFRPKISTRSQGLKDSAAALVITEPIAPEAKVSERIALSSFRDAPFACEGADRVHTRGRPHEPEREVEHVDGARLRGGRHRDSRA